MARVLSARHCLGWLALCAAFGAVGCVIVEKSDDDDDDVVAGPTPAPGPAPAPTTPSASPSGPTGEVFTLVNQARATARSCGNEPFKAAAPLRWSEPLARAAQGHSEDMASKDYFDHTTPDGADMAARVKAQGYAFSLLGENIAAGQATPAEAVRGWLESPGHCRNIMNADFQELGVGRAEGGSYRIYWTQNFGSPR